MDAKIPNSFAESFAETIRAVVREELERVVARDKPAEPLLLDIHGAHELTNLPESWIANAARRGELPVVRCGHHVRFAVADLKQFIEQKKVAPSRQNGATQSRGDSSHAIKRISRAT
jgi:excisionase family DNA binding protein